MTTHRVSEAKRRVSRFFGWLFVTEAYLDSCSDEEVGIAALGEKRYRVHKMSQYLNGTLPERIH